ncbi:sulfurtransferase TusA family protein [Pengzhenrongella frigida]|uniref:Sulfurtransferase TusA family protein n=1 Tax=Pengzhenrongella frigida TaxID=1259133 RepID=A0A4V1ZGZ9_9MICO|nr:sulfurtransferase TusA family protein [Cellulomonas sp. HLT2-17]RYV50304.1 sulfurtransferase TusA family protein [Cellulomonas sp. HLT2-17]
MTGAEPVVVDARHLRCPLPVIELAKAARDAPGGTVLTVLTTDPAARHDVPAWARLRGHALVSIETVSGSDRVAMTDGDVLAITVRTSG